MKKLTSYLLFASMMIVSFAASAVPVTYQFTGTGSGDFAGQGFTDVAFSVVINSDTDLIDNPGRVNYANDIGGITDATITLTGLGTFNFMDPVYVFLNYSNDTVGFGNDINHDLIDITDPALVGYDLSSSIGPISTATPFFSQFNNVGLVGENMLSFSAMVDASFQAFTGPQTSVPAPASILLMGLGLIGLGFSKRKKNLV